MRRRLAGTAIALAAVVIVTGIMLPLRSHLGIVTPALVLVVPVVIGVVAGGFVAGVVSVVAGFLIDDFLFIPPYLNLSVGDLRNWAALGVYAVVMLLVARVVASMNDARAEARRQRNEIRELFQLSDLLVEDKPLDTLLTVTVSALAEVFGANQVSLLLPRGEVLEVAASAGEPLTVAEREHLLPAEGELASLPTQPVEKDGSLVIALTAAGRPVGVLVVSGEATAAEEREPLLLFANHVALAVERGQLREQALRTRVTEEMARLARTLIAAVSHDLRTPLGSIKASSSMLADDEMDIGPESRRQLAALIDAQVDRLAELVRDLLDMSRIQAGVLQPRYALVPLDELVARTVSSLAATLSEHELRVSLPEDLPPLDIDDVLISRVLANLLENAARHGPRRTPIIIEASLGPRETVVVSVADKGPGVRPDLRNDVFELFARRAGDSGAGLGLAIAKIFIEAHGQRIWMEDSSRGGARFCFTLPLATSMPERTEIAADTHH